MRRVSPLVGLVCLSAACSSGWDTAKVAPVATVRTSTLLGVQCGIALTPVVTDPQTGAATTLLPSRYTLHARVHDPSAGETVDVATADQGWQLEARRGLDVDYDVTDNQTGVAVLRDQAHLVCGSPPALPVVSPPPPPTRPIVRTGKGTASGHLTAKGPMTGTWQLDVVGCDGVDQKTEWSADDLSYQTVLVGADGLRVAIRFDAADRLLPARVAVENLSLPRQRWALFRDKGDVLAPENSDDDYRCREVEGDITMHGFQASAHVRLACASPSGASIEGSVAFDACPDTK